MTRMHLQVFIRKNTEENYLAFEIDWGTDHSVLPCLVSCLPMSSLWRSKEMISGKDKISEGHQGWQHHLPVWHMVDRLSSRTYCNTIRKHLCSADSYNGWYWWIQRWWSLFHGEQQMVWPQEHYYALLFLFPSPRASYDYVLSILPALWVDCSHHHCCVHSTTIR